MYFSLHSRLATKIVGVAFLCLAPAAASAAAVEPSDTSTSSGASRIRFAQSGSMGGTIGNREKSLSGARDVERERPAHRSKSQRSQRERSPRHSGGGGNYDGAWTVTSIGCSGAGTGVVVVTSGRLIGQGISGSISPNGTIRSVSNVGNGVRAIGSGRASGRRASGIYRQTDGCTGRFTAVKN